jgi:hypothetical protein
MTRGFRPQQTLAMQQDLLVTFETGLSISFRLKLLNDPSYYGPKSKTGGGWLSPSAEVDSTD